jgi:hypothetical protein
VSYGGVNVGASYGTSGWGVSAGIGFGDDQFGFGFSIGYGSGGWRYGIGGYYNPYFQQPQQAGDFSKTGGVKSNSASTGLPDGRMIWELTDEELILFTDPNTRSQVTGCDCDIQLTVVERIYLAGKIALLVAPAARVRTLYQAEDFIRYSDKTLVSNQIIVGKGAKGAQTIPALKGGGVNPTTGKSLPYHFHIHRYNFYKPWTWFNKTAIIKK